MKCYLFIIAVTGWYGVAGGRCGRRRTLETEHDGVSSVVRALVICIHVLY